jgi:hypothetical protein
MPINKQGDRRYHAEGRRCTDSRSRPKKENHFKFTGKVNVWFRSAERYVGGGPISRADHTMHKRPNGQRT